MPPWKRIDNEIESPASKSTECSTYDERIKYANDAHDSTDEVDIGSSNWNEGIELDGDGLMFWRRRIR